MDTASDRSASDRPQDLPEGHYSEDDAQYPEASEFESSADDVDTQDSEQDFYDAQQDEGFEESDEPLSDPTLSELLAGSARGDQPSFATFYEATSDVVYGLALLMHADVEGAQESTQIGRASCRERVWLLV